MCNAKTGISGLDEILSGGLSRGHVFLLEGEPGAGKTTVAVQFLLEGAKAGERSLYITLSETEQELRQGAASHGWTLGSEIEVFEFIPPESLLAEEQQQSLLYSYDLELRETTNCRAREAQSRGARQSLRNSPYGSKLAPISAPPPLDQALFRPSWRHRDLVG